MAIFGSFTLLLLVLTNSIPSTASQVPILGKLYSLLTHSAPSLFPLHCSDEHLRQLHSVAVGADRFYSLDRLHRANFG